MGKRRKKIQNETVVNEETVNQEEEIEVETSDEEEEVEMKKKLLDRIPKWVKVAGGVVLTAATAAGTTLMIMSKSNNHTDLPISDCESDDSYDTDYDTVSGSCDDAGTDGDI